MSNMNQLDKTPYRVRHELKFREITVKNITNLSLTMLRIEFEGESLADFVSASFDDHIKVFLPDPITKQLPRPSMTEQGVKFESGVKPEMRDYTPRAFDQNAKTLVIDFAIHEAGAATDWARQAKVGDQLTIGGPRGSMIIPLAYSHYVLVGDETALPAIARRLEELPASVKATVLIEVASQASEIALPSQATVDIHWLHRDGAEAGTHTFFDKQLKNIQLPNEDYFIWIAAETHVARYLRKLLIENYQIDKSCMKAAGYWQRGQSNVHSVIQDE